MEGGQTTSRRSPRRWLEAGDVAPLELLVGHEDYDSTLASSWARFIIPIGLTGGVAIVLPGSNVSTAVKVTFLLTMVVVAGGSSLVKTTHTRLPAVAYIWISLLGVVPVTLLLRGLGPAHAEAAALIPAAIGTTFIFHTRARAVLLGVAVVTGYAIVLTGPGNPGAASKWVLVAGMVASFGAMSAWIASKLRTLAAAERAATAEVERLNASLATTVAEQVDEIESLSALERFLSPQIAATVRRSSDASLLEPHRRQIAVLFADLRGFTGFAAGAEPEDVVEVLTAYYATVGELVRELDATIGSFIGDGIMAYFNDPYPCDDPAGRAVEMAVRLRPALDELADRWRRRGYQLGYGIGIAYGYATLGTVGFEGRSDYTALGTVVNLAARLCGEAASGEVLVDARAFDELAGRCAADDVELQLKGFSGSVKAHRIAR